MNSNSVTILYGSDTGTAQDYAVFLLKRLRYLLLKPTVAALDEYPLKKLVTDTKFLIVICATAGQGELPRNGKKFMKFLLKKKLPGDLLNHIFLTSFGLGDSSYPKFNYAIKKLHTRLKQLGCNDLSLRCEADEQSSEGLDGYYTEWEYHLLEALKSYFPDMVALDESTVLRPQNITVVDKQGDDIHVNDGITDKDISISRTIRGDPLKIGTIDSNTRITSPDHFQDVRHLTIKANGLDYKPGDTVGLFPSNDPENVQALLELQPHWLEVADKPLKIKGSKIPYIEGQLIDDQYMTLRNLLIHHLDIMSIPTRSFFFSLWHFVDSSTEDGQREQEKLRDFCNFEESEELYNYANRPRRLILETLLEFQNNLRIPIEHVFEIFPKIKPRLFSIASNPSPDSVELVIAIVEYQTIIKRIRKGLCTSWLKTLNVGDKIIFSIHKQGMEFELPDVPNPPLILIGPGTGVAPMKSLIEFTAQHKSQPMYLFFGFRSEDHDFMFKDVWEQLVAQNKLHLFPCISRSKTVKKQYVQNGIFEKGDLMADLILNQNAILYVCGSSGPMPRQVRETIVAIIEKTGKSQEESLDYLHKMENTGRYIQETW